MYLWQKTASKTANTLLTALGFPLTLVRNFGAWLIRQLTLMLRGARSECAESTPDSWHWLLILTRGNYFGSPSLSNIWKTSLHKLSAQLNPLGDQIGGFDQSHGCKGSQLEDKVTLSHFSNVCSSAGKDSDRQHPDGRLTPSCAIMFWGFSTESSSGYIHLKTVVSSINCLFHI